MKYEITNNKKEVKGVTVYQIKRVSNGDLGGYVQSSYNLNQRELCWIDSGAVVMGAARVTGNAYVSGTKTLINGDITISGNSSIKNTIIEGQCLIQRSKIEGARIKDSNIKYTRIHNPQGNSATGEKDLIITNSFIGNRVAKYQTDISCYGKIVNSKIECFNYVGNINIIDTQITTKDFVGKKIPEKQANKIFLSNCFSNGEPKSNVYCFKTDMDDEKGELYVCYRPTNGPRVWGEANSNKMAVWTTNNSDSKINRFRNLKYLKLKDIEPQNKYISILVKEILDINSKQITQIQDQILNNLDCEQLKNKQFLKMAIKLEILRIADFLAYANSIIEDEAIPEHKRKKANGFINDLVNAHALNFVTGNISIMKGKNPFAANIKDSEYISAAIALGMKQGKNEYKKTRKAD